MKVNVTWQGKMRFETETPSGHTVTMDAAPGEFDPGSG
jgi:putative redox protein